MQPYLHLMQGVTTSTNARTLRAIHAHPNPTQQPSPKKETNLPHNATCIKRNTRAFTINGPSYRLRGRTDILKDAASPDSNEPDQPEEQR